MTFDPNQPTWPVVSTDEELREIADAFKGLEHSLPAGRYDSNLETLRSFFPQLDPNQGGSDE